MQAYRREPRLHLHKPVQYRVVLGQCHAHRTDLSPSIAGRRNALQAALPEWPRPEVPGVGSLQTSSSVHEYTPLNVANAVAFVKGKAGCPALPNLLRHIGATTQEWRRQLMRRVLGFTRRDQNAQLT